MLPDLEHFFYGDVRRGLQAITGVAKLEDLKTTAALVLPEHLHQSSTADLAETLDDGAERWRTFGLVRGQIGTVNQKVGTKINPRTLSAVGNSVSRAELIFSFIGGTPDPVHAHTHPTMNVKDYGEHLHRTVKTPFGKISFKQELLLLNLLSSSFSPDDLNYFDWAGMMTRAMLLTNEHGFRFVIRPDLNFPSIPLFKFARYDYARVLAGVEREQLQAIVETGKPSIMAEDFRKQADIKLRDYCAGNGYALFGNEDYRSPVLQNLGGN